MKPLLSRFWRRAVRAIGYSGPAALLLLLVALGVALWLPRLHRELQRTQAEVSDRTARLRTHGAVPLREPSGEERLAQYIEGFPLPTQMAADLGAIYASAGRNRLDLPKGDYQLKAEPGSPFVTYVVTLPVHAEYAPVKAFAANVLLELPHASLDELRLSRDSAQGEVLDAVVRFTLVYRSR
ncbi:hypothetical protein HHL11_11995 [Ramlibacter sp. G-1-2-2]|uniref:Pilus assembly protein PilO n=1 Tax=Ramlibacter agri TaxID=2728837 RepID=A0A848H1X6_9BURK|nr:hypothetical protein [Ramlibacter agri]NML44477.1 hypothetical protein [Ramlibacter agri]